MSMPGRFKSTAGGDIVPAAKRTVPSATTMVVPDWTNLFYVSGTTTVSAMTIPSHLRCRLLTFIGAASASVTFTNTNSPTAGQMYLRGSNRLVTEDVVIQLLVKEDGTITLVGFTG